MEHGEGVLVDGPQGQLGEQLPQAAGPRVVEGQVRAQAEEGLELARGLDAWLETSYLPSVAAGIKARKSGGRAKDAKS